MNKKVIAPAAGIGALFLLGVWGWQRGDIVVNSDPGGNILTLYQEYYDQYQAGQRHVIAGRCASACTMRLIFDTTCVTPSAQLGFHRTYYVKIGSFAMGSAWGDQFMLDRIPKNIRGWLDDQGGISHDMKWLSGPDAVALGVKACE